MKNNYRFAKKSAQPRKFDSRGSSSTKGPKAWKTPKKNSEEYAAA